MFKNIFDISRILIFSAGSRILSVSRMQEGSKTGPELQELRREGLELLNHSLLLLWPSLGMSE